MTTWMMVLKHWRILGSVLLLGIGITSVTVLVHERDAALVARGTALERVRVADSTLAVLRPQLTRVDTLVRHDVKTVLAQVSHTDTLRDTVLAHLTDTVLVREFVTRADSALYACTALAHDCETYRATATATIAALTSKLSVPVAIRPPAASCRVETGVWGILGALSGYGLARIHHP